MGGVHHCSGPPVSEMTYTVSSGTLNSTIPHHTFPVVRQSPAPSVRRRGRGAGVLRMLRATTSHHQSHFIISCCVVVRRRPAGRAGGRPSASSFCDATTPPAGHDDDSRRRTTSGHRRVTISRRASGALSPRERKDHRTLPRTPRRRCRRPTVASMAIITPQ